MGTSNQVDDKGMMIMVIMVMAMMAMMIVFGVDDKGMRHPGKLTRGDFLRSFSNAVKFILSPRYCHQKTLRQNRNPNAGKFLEKLSPKEFFLSPR